MTFIYQSLYNLGIQVMGLFVNMAGLVNSKIQKRSKGNDHWKTFTKNEEPLAWFHCASLGEFEQGRPVLEAFKLAFPNYKILLTFFSPSGYEVRKNYQNADYVSYLPLDTTENTRKFIEHFKPRIAFFVKYEFWRNYALALKKNEIPLISFSTIFRSNQVFFKPFGKFPRQTLEVFEHFFVQNESSKKLLNSVAIHNVSIAGDTRYDRVQNNKDACQPISIIEIFKGSAATIVVGSAWQQDMELLIPIINDPTFAAKKFIIAPHEINSLEIAKWTKQITVPVQRYSTFDSKNETNVLFIDNIGMLSAIYQYGYAAFIGGAFGKGLHNILEAAVFGIPVFFGNKQFEKFQEAIELIDLGSAKAIANTEELKNELLFLENTQVRNTIRDKNATFIKHNLGASKKVIDYCKTILTK